MHQQHQTLFLAALTIGGIALAAPAPAEAAAATIPIVYPYGDTLITGQSLLAGQGLISKSGDYTLVLQADGNFVEYCKSPSPAQRKTISLALPLLNSKLKPPL